MDLNQALETFFEEARDLLQAMEDALLRIESGEGSDDDINAIFRAAHTIKGSAGLFGLDAVVGFTHHVESLLDLVRANKLQASPDMVSVLLSCGDHIARLVEAVAAGASAPSADLAAESETLVAALGQFMPGKAKAAASARSQPVPAVQEPRVEKSGGGEVGSDCWHISVRFGPEVFRNGMDPLSFLRYLATLGDVAYVATLPDAMPAAADMDPESCYLGFEIDLRSVVDKQTIEGVFEFVRDDCRLHILPPRSRIEDFVRLIHELPEDPRRLGEILVAGGAITQRELDDALGAQRQSDHPDQRRPLGEILVDDGVVQEPVVTAALEKQKKVEEKRALEQKSIKVHADKLDHLINLVGELVIAGATVGSLAQRTRNGEMTEATSQLARLVEEIRDSALQLRMVQIGETFNRFPRVVRDVSRDLGKPIELAITGAETELDKSMVEKIADPLMHLVRNAMDHGIEPAELRAQRGKPAAGRLGLNAYHDSGSIVIEVSDDGGGLNRARIRAKAVERGLISPDAELTDQQVVNLVLEPGFSTAEAVTNLSGRGVGMDVVKRNVEALRGNLELLSEEGRGTKVLIRLPLTLAIIDGFMVKVGRGHYVVPLDMVVECVELEPASHDRHYVNLRGAVLPYLRLREQFEVAGARPKRENIVVVKFGERRAGLVVDELLGEFQTVIKPMGTLFRHLRGITGSTILGTGEVALILDVPALVNLARDQEGIETGRTPRALGNVH